MKPRLLVLLLLCFSLVLAAPSAVLTGRITDTSGAAIPAAKVEVVSLATGQKTAVETSAEGLYLVPGLAPGRYSVSVAKDGFRTAKVKEVVLNVSMTATQDIQLELGVLTNSVEVRAESTLVDRAAISVSTTVDRQFAANLPLNGRSFQTLLEMTPGINLVSATGAASPGQFVVNGQRSNANYFTIDGVSANVGASVNIQIQQQAAGSVPGLTAMGGTNNLVSVDALEEFRVQTSTFAPEYGRMPGGQITLTTRSGTNQFTGSLYEYFRNDKLDANDWFANAAGTTRAPMRQNNFGGVLGGPVTLPKLYNGRDRTFFFFSYEGQHNRLPQFVDALVPNQASRDKAIPQMKPLLSMNPLPNSPALPGDPAGVGRYVASYGDPQQLDASAIKINHRLTPKINIFGRYSYSPSSSAQRVFANQHNSIYMTTKTATVGADYAITSKIFNEFRANYSNYTGRWNFEQLLGNGAEAAPDSLWPAGWDRTTATVSVSMGLLNYGTANNLTLGPVVGNGQRQWNIVDTISYTRGRHTFKAGIDWRRLNPLASTRRRSFSYSFASVETAALTGVAGSFSTQGFAPPGHFRFDNFSGFLQDSWRATPRLTLTYGVRWEVNPAPGERDGRLPYTVIGLENPLTAQLAPQGTPLYPTQWNNVTPRVGVAYQVSRRHELLVRAGWGIYSDLGSGLSLTGFQGWPYQNSKSTMQVAFPASGAALDPGMTSTTPPVVASNVYAFPNLGLPKTYQWNVTAEKGFGPANLLTASYVGAGGRDLLLKDRLANSVDGSIAQLNPAVFLKGSSVQVARNGSTSDYHALQTQFRRRLDRGLQAQVSYTWSHALDDVSDETATTLPLWRPESALQRGSSSFDVRHSFTAAVTYDLPGFRRNRALAALTQHWGVNSMIRFRTSMPINLVQSTDLLNAGVSSVVRPDLVYGQPIVIDDPKVAGGRRLNSAAFATFTQARQGTLGRNAIRGFDRVRQLDLSIRREFVLTEKWNLQFRGEFFNITNTPNFGQPTLSLTSARFGQSTSMMNRSLGSYSTGGASQGFSPLYQIGGPRSVQLSLRLSF